MSANLEMNGVIVDSNLYTVDDAPKYALGTEFKGIDGNTYRYIKSSAALTAGTAYATAGYTAFTATATDGGATVTATTPSSAVSGDLVGELVRITRDGSVIGVFPITEDIYNGTNHIVKIAEAKAGDTLAHVYTGTGFAGGSASSSAGAINGTPLTAIASGKYGFVLVGQPIIAS